MERRVILVFVLLLILSALLTGCASTTGDIKGIWYEETGYFGSIEFKEGDIATVVIKEKTMDCTYTYDTSKGEGTLRYNGANSNIVVTNEKMKLDGVVYTRKAVVAKDLGKLMDELTNAGLSAGIQ